MNQGTATTGAEQLPPPPESRMTSGAENLPPPPEQQEKAADKSGEIVSSKSNEALAISDTQVESIEALAQHPNATSEDLQRIQSLDARRMSAEQTVVLARDGFMASLRKFKDSLKTTVQAGAGVVKSAGRSISDAITSGSDMQRIHDMRHDALFARAQAEMALTDNSPEAPEPKAEEGREYADSILSSIPEPTEAEVAEHAEQEAKRTAQAESEPQKTLEAAEGKESVQTREAKESKENPAKLLSAKKIAQEVFNLVNQGKLKGEQVKEYVEKKSVEAAKKLGLPKDFEKDISRRLKKKVMKKLASMYKELQAVVGGDAETSEKEKNTEEAVSEKASNQEDPNVSEVREYADSILASISDSTKEEVAEHNNQVAQQGNPQSSFTSYSGKTDYSFDPFNSSVGSRFVSTPSYGQTSEQASYSTLRPSVEKTTQSLSGQGGASSRRPAIDLSQFDTPSSN